MFDSPTHAFLPRDLARIWIDSEYPEGLPEGYLWVMMYFLEQEVSENLADYLTFLMMI